MIFFAQVEKEKQSDGDGGDAQGQEEWRATRTHDGIVRAKIKSGLQNFACNTHRLVILKRATTV